MIIEFLKNILKESANLWLAVSPYLLLGMFIAGSFKDLRLSNKQDDMFEGQPY